MTQDIEHGAAAMRLIPLVLCVVCIAPFVGLLAPSDLIVSDPARDYASLHLPLWEFARRELLAGRLPLWNPYVGCGQPLHAAQQSSLCYPLAAPLILACGANYGLKLSLFFHLVVCFTGAYLLARRLDITCVGAAYAAMTMTWSGALMGHLAEGHVSMVYQSALVPWLFMGLMKLLAAPVPMHAVQLIIAGSLCALADHPQVLYYTFIGALLLAAWSVSVGDASHHRRRAIAWIAVAGISVTLTSAVQMIPAIELLRDGLHDSERAASDFGGTYALNGADVARFVMPYLNGTPFAQVPQFNRNDHYHERVVYLGLGVPLLAAYGLSRSTTVRWQWAAAWSMILTVAIALGDSTPVFCVLGKVLPGLSLFRCPGRVFCVGSLPAALLAARGVDDLAQAVAGAGRTTWTQLTAVLWVGASIISYAVIFNPPSFDRHRYAHYLQTHLCGHLLIWAMLAIGVSAIFALAKTWRLRGCLVSMPLVCVTALDLCYFNVANFRMENRETLIAKLPRADSMARAVTARDVRRMTYDSLRYCRQVRTTMAAGQLSVATYDGGVLPGATARLYKAIEADPPQTLVLAACRFICSANNKDYEVLPSALPRLRFIDAKDAAVVDAHVGDGATFDSQRICDHELGIVKVVEEIPTRTTIELDLRKAGCLVLADTWYPGWKATVDGHAVRIARAHGVFRSIDVPSGRHRVVFAYQPMSFRLGLTGSAIGVMFATLLMLDSLRRVRMGQ